MMIELTISDLERSGDLDMLIDETGNMNFGWKRWKKEENVDDK